jgi:hypothetical protein
MSESTISLKTVNDLRHDAEGKPRRYFIAAYQRGYRWAPLQVTQLLDDIREFAKRRNPQPEEFYCLQPLVIRMVEDGLCEIVDGQQRLTTLLLILRHFNERLAEKYKQPLFSLDYETRPGLLNFLNEPTPERAESNPDYFHLYSAIQAIDGWFADKESEVEEVKSTLLGKTKVIWYQITESESPVDVFTRLNVGKIPLTNDELVRALFLRKQAGDGADALNMQMRIAYEWDHIEKSLQSDSFWYFVSNENRQSQSRIGLLFDLVANQVGIPPEYLHDPLVTFFTYNSRLKQPDRTLESEWKQIKKTFLQLEEWYEDRTLFHMVGFLVSDGFSINEIARLSSGCLKSEFEQRLRTQIYKRLVDQKSAILPEEAVVREQIQANLDGLRYGSNRIRAMLLLFNVVTLLQSNRSNIRFQFDCFKSQSWNIEHVRSVTDYKPDRHHERVKWLQHCLGYLATTNAEPGLQADINDYIALPMNDAGHDVFDPIYEHVISFFHEDSGDETDHSIANLALLDEHTNKSYKNAVFAVKRKRLLELDQSGIFVPLCTRNVFLKCYSPQVDNAMFWTEQDQNGYLNALTEALVNFFMDKKGGEL